MKIELTRLQIAHLWAILSMRERECDEAIKIANDEYTKEMEMTQLNHVEELRKIIEKALKSETKGD